MSSQWSTKTDDWGVKPAIFTAQPGRRGFQGSFRMSIYSSTTGFLGEVSMTGSIAGFGNDVTLSFPLPWQALDTSRSFSPDELNGASGSLKFATFGFGLGANALLGSARLKGTKTFLFENAPLLQGGVGLGISAGWVVGQWKIDQVWSDAGLPGSQAAAESVGGGDARPASSGMSETG